MATAFILFVLSARLHAGGVITTIAGASAQDNIPATQSLLNFPGGIAADGVGNFYLADTHNHRIRRVDGGTGIITTIAGTGVGGYSGDHGPAILAQLNQPGGLSYVFASSTSYLYVADTANHRVRRIDLGTGVITTAAGTGVGGFGGDGGLGIFASFNAPKGVCADASGNIYVADTANHRVRRVHALTQSVTTVAGTGSPAFSGDGGSGLEAALNSPEALALAPGGMRLTIADTGNLRVRQVDLGGGAIATVAGTGAYGYSGDGGPALNATFSTVKGLYFGLGGGLYISDSFNNRVRRVDPGSLSITSVAGTGTASYSGDGGPASLAGLNNPQGLCQDPDGNSYVVDYSNNCVRKILASGAISTVAGSGIQEGLPGTRVILKSPRGLALMGSRLLFAEAGSAKVRSLDLASGVISTFAGTGSAVHAGDGGQASLAGLAGPKELALGPSGEVYLADSALRTYYSYYMCGFFTFCSSWITSGESRIRRIDSSGVITTLAGGPQLANTGDGGPASAAGLGDIQGLCRTGQHLYLSDAYFHLIRRIDLVSGIISAFGGVSGTAGMTGDRGPVSLATFNTPRGLAADAAGNLYLADSGNNAVRRIAPGTGEVTTVCGLGPTKAGYSGDKGPATAAALFAPSAVFVDPGGNLFIADSGNHRLRRVDAATGIIDTVMGSGFRGFAGDGGPPQSALLDSPGGVCLDKDSTAYLADTGNGRIRRADNHAGPGPTPVMAGPGRVVAYPSPADGRICLSFHALQAGDILIELFNTAMQLVARITDQAAVQGAFSTCASIRELPSGVYLYRVSCNRQALPPGKFKVAHP